MSQSNDWNNSGDSNNRNKQARSNLAQQAELENNNNQATNDDAVQALTQRINDNDADPDEC
ncbi:hypothetical protein [Paenibacillus sp. J2TS4]|uniref:hypothetical protein n=1 Tax=Paenibacillus sp. J2TS4 TaxID=2807194 RepID=UPI001B05BED3|nr:hypothetical protein [Paenibacillus sp. J2TS4]GIP34298.1 hypothetical protein J2TS4_35080 [Paenibacillus sp. J2TS4]